MKSNTAIKTMVIAFIVMIGMTGLGAATQLNVTLENKNSTWQPIADGISAVVKYDSSGDDFVWSASGTAPLANTSYSLIYYADKPNRFVNWGGDNPGALIGTMTTNGTGVFTASGSINLDMDLPCPPDANMNISEHNYCGAPDYYTHCTGAKLWMVPTAALPNPYPGTGVWSFWNTGGILFETDLITYTDCDLYDTSPPANATFTIEDALVGEPINITIKNATNVGAVKVVLTYNASSVTLSNVVNGDMDTTYSNDIGGQVTIGAAQGNTTGLNGDFTLAGLNFTHIGNGTYDFLLYVTTYKDATPCGRTMPYDFDGNGSMYLNGDVNDDGVVDMFDVMYLAKHLIGIDGFEDIIELASDVDGSGTIDVADVSYLAKHIIGYPGYETLK